MTSAMRLRTAARSVREVSPQASLAAWAASSASSTSSGVDLATSQNGLPSTGLTLAMYFPSTGATQPPPMKFSYRGLTSTRLPGRPGATKGASDGGFSVVSDSVVTVIASSTVLVRPVGSRHVRPGPVAWRRR
jgi:hypothetical protein